MTSAEHEDGEGAQPATRYASPVAAVTAILRHAKAKRLGLDTMLGREAVSGTELVRSGGRDHGRGQHVTAGRG